MELVKLAFKLGSKLSKCLVFSFIEPNKILIYSSQKNVLVNYHAYEDIRLKHWFSRQISIGIITVNPPEVRPVFALSTRGLKLITLPT